MAKARRDIVSVEATSYYHCISRCVRRAFLCGHDRLSERNFDHRKQWLVERMKELATIFAIDVCAYAVLSNHFHLILHVDHERAAGWTDEEVARRYAKLFPHTERTARTLPERARREKLALWRRRLWDLSWYMRCLNESIARRANREEKCSGRFWEGRFRCQALLDEGAVLTCMAYVDLNPIRAGIATTLQECDFTSIRERVLAAANPNATQALGLVPFAEEKCEEGGKVLPMSFADYAEVLRWMAAGVSGGPCGQTPEQVRSALGQAGLESQGFVAAVRHYARNFFTMVGHVHRIDAESRRRQYRRRPGRRAARQLYRNVAA